MDAGVVLVFGLGPTFVGVVVGLGMQPRSPATKCSPAGHVRELGVCVCVG